MYMSVLHNQGKQDSQQTGQSNCLPFLSAPMTSAMWRLALASSVSSSAPAAHARIKDEGASP